MSKSATSSLELVVAISVYFALSIGGFGIADPSLASVLLMSVSFAIALASFFVRAQVPRIELSVLLIFISIMIFQAIRTKNPEYAFAKLDGSVLAVIALWLIAWSGVRTGEDGFVRAFVLVAFSVFLATIVYKLSFGFLDRSIRFFLNGPIVFGWIMGIAALLCVYLAPRQGRIYYAFGVAFLLAVLWTESKGPFVALAVSLAFLLAGNFSVRKFFVLSGVGVGVAGSVVWFNLFPDRYHAIGRIVSGGVEQADWGSIGIREFMWTESFWIFISNPLLGVGLGNWRTALGHYDVLPHHLIYPHNLFFEVLSETGLLGFFGIAAMAFLVFLKASLIGRVVFLFSGVALMFSGDAAYWHFLIAFPAIFSVRRKRCRVGC